MLVSGAMLVGLLSVSAWAQVGAPAGAKIATVNPAKVLDGMQEQKDAQQKLNQFVSKLRDEEMARRNEVKAMQDKRKDLDPKSEQYRQLTSQIATKQIELEAWARIQQAEAGRQQKETMVQLYRKITEAVEKVAIKKGYDVVLSSQLAELPENMQEADVNQIRAMIIQRNPIYDNGKNDLTQDVILQLNSDYMAKPK
jgi:Skp family chaperone for outer membrane proteins